MSDRLTMGDVRRAGYCVRGSRRWFEATGRDFKLFLREGMPMDEARQIDDAVVKDILKKMGVNDG
ncbi:hypothetical protein [Neoaquamicrobium sediminum]|uniref:hypothetical protein n=1 Tax=Neoaquamicrobium sediminum TaxID=1849104 RepID=UPI0015671566|nr:hypothetical protein [Mesorhizobium sediminum]NRC54133.1 hypothetical protein [Mesorhizobium sediminum]